MAIGNCDTYNGDHWTKIVPITTGLVLWYTPDYLTGDWQDKSGSGVYGDVLGTATRTPIHSSGAFGNAFTLDGITGNIRCLANQSYPSFSIEMWVKTNELGRKQFLSEKEASYAYEGTLSLDAGGTFTFQVYDGTISSTITSTQVYSLRWHHIVATRDSITGILTLYVDGVEAKPPVTGTTGALGIPTFRRFGAGTRAPTGRYFNGIISEARVYNRVLTQNEALYNYYNSPTYYIVNASNQ